MSAAFALLAVVLPVVNGVHVTPLLTLGFGAWVPGRALGRSRTARYGLDRRVERAELWALRARE